MTTTKKLIEIPKYVLQNNQNIPEDLKKVIDYFRDCGNKNYQVCLIGEKESMKKDLKDSGYQSDYPFIHFNGEGLDSNYAFIPEAIKKSIQKVNNLISNNENVFNITPLGIHTLGLVKISEIKLLNELDYGNTFWNSIGVFKEDEDKDEENEEGIGKKFKKFGKKVKKKVKKGKKKVKKGTRNLREKKKKTIGKVNKANRKATKANRKIDRLLRTDVEDAAKEAALKAAEKEIDNSDLSEENKKKAKEELSSRNTDDTSSARNGN